LNFEIEVLGDGEVINDVEGHFPYPGVICGDNSEMSCWEYEVIDSNNILVSVFYCDLI
jgi:hypothetical protein